MKTQGAHRLSHFGEGSVWLEFSPLARHTGAVNLGQGFPDTPPPEFVQKIASEVINDPQFSQYARSQGHLNLCHSVSEVYSEKLNHEIHPEKEVLVTDGASQALYLACVSFINPGDEVVVIEPAFDLYDAVIKMAGGVPKYVPLDMPREGSGEVAVDWERLEAAFSGKTRMMFLNTPHNPTGFVFSEEDYRRLDKIIEKFPDTIVISDEVYEHLVYDGGKHLSYAAIPERFKRTLSIFSSGKTFSCTGWKIGWTVGPRELISKMQLAQQWVVFSVATPLQEVIAQALREANKPYGGEKDFYTHLRRDYQEKRDLMSRQLKEVGLEPIIPKGSFFIVARTAGWKESYFQTQPQEWSELKQAQKISVDKNTLHLEDYNFCRNLAVQKKVVAIPPSAFYCEEHQKMGQGFVRIAFCKKKAVLKDVCQKLR